MSRAPERHPGVLVRHAREAAYLTQQQLADRAGVSQAGLSRIETGRRNVDWATLVRLLGVFDLQPVLATESVDAAIHRVLRSESGRDPVEWLDDLPDGRSILRMLAELPLTADGSFGARLHGLPVTVRQVDLLVDPAPKVLPQISRWLARAFTSLQPGADARSFVVRLPSIIVNLHLLDEPAAVVRIEPPRHLDGDELPPGTTVAVSPVHLLRLSRDDRRIAAQATAAAAEVGGSMSQGT